MEKTGCEIVCGAPTTLAIQGLMMLMIMTCVSYFHKLYTCQFVKIAVQACDKAAKFVYNVVKPHKQNITSIQISSKKSSVIWIIVTQSFKHLWVSEKTTTSRFCNGSHWLFSQLSPITHVKTAEPNILRIVFMPCKSDCPLRLPPKNWLGKLRHWKRLQHQQK